MGGNKGMPYAIRYRRKAKEELEKCCDTYGEELEQELYLWLGYLAEAAQRKESSGSIDVLELLETGLETVETGGRVAWQRFRQASFLEKVKAFVVFLKNRQPPWQVRSSIRHFTFLGRCSCEVAVFYEVDHIHHQIVLSKFDGLPGQ